MTSGSAPPESSGATSNAELVTNAQKVSSQKPLPERSPPGKASGEGSTGRQPPSHEGPGVSTASADDAPLSAEDPSWAGSSVSMGRPRVMKHVGTPVATGETSGRSETGDRADSVETLSAGPLGVGARSSTRSGEMVTGDERPPMAIKPKQKFSAAAAEAFTLSGEGFATPPETPTTAARWLPWTAVLGSGVLIAALCVVLWVALSPRKSVVPPQDAVASDSNRVSPPPSVGTTDAEVPPVMMTPPWWRDLVPPQSRFFVYGDFRVLPATQIFPLLAEFGGTAWEECFQVALQELRLHPEALGEAVWARGDFDTKHPGIIAIKLLPKHSAKGLAVRGQETDFSLFGTVFRYDPASRWLHPFGVPESSLVITGERQLLEELGRRLGINIPFESAIFDRLWKQLPSDVVGAAAIDVGSLRQSGWESPIWIMDVWPEVAPAWRVVCQIPTGIVTFYRDKPQPLWQVGLLCPSATAAAQFAEAFTTLVKFAHERLKELAEGVSSGELLESQDTAGPRKSVIWLTILGVVGAMKGEVVEDFFWLRLSPPSDASFPSEAHGQWQERLKEQWLAAGLIVDRSHHETFQRALGEYRGKFGHFPPGVGGAALLPPETRLSWMALLLPHLGLADWYNELHFGFSWNSAQNRPVTQRELAPAINPSLGDRRRVEGFPVTHYVGVGGVGADAPMLPESHPRAGVFGYNRKLRLEDIPDGASNTAAIFGVYDRLGPWAAGGLSTLRPLTTPPYVNGPDGFGSGQPSGMLMAMADGSVRFISASVDPQVLEQLAAIADGAPREIDLVAKTAPVPTRIEAVSQVSMQGWDGGVAGQKSPSVAGGPGLTADPKAPSVPQGEVGRSHSGAGGSPGTPADQLAAVRLAARLGGLRASAVCLADAVRTVGQLANVPVSFDFEAISALGISILTRVEVTVPAETFESALHELVRTAGLALVVDSGQVVVTVPADYRTKLLVKRHNVSDILAASGTAQDLENLVVSFVAPESWKSNGGQATLRLEGDTLEVEQTELGHRLIQSFLERLRLARQRASGSKMTTKLETARPILAKTVSVNFFEQTPLTRILGELERQTGVKLLVNWRSLYHDGLVPEPRGVLSVQNESLAQALEQLLLPLGLGYRVVEPQVMEIATRKFLGSVLEVEFYPVGDLLQVLAQEHGSREAAEEVLLEAISDQVEGQSWADAGGPARLFLERVSQHVIVLQSQSVHKELEGFFARFRSEWLHDRW